MTTEHNISPYVTFKQNALLLAFSVAGIADLGCGNPVGFPILDGAFNPDGLGKLI